MITAEEIVIINQELLHNKDTKITNLDCSSCLASYMYYTDIKDQIASIVIGIIKNHYFIDANKRTGLAVFYKLCKNNGIILDRKDRAKAINAIASSKMSVEEVVKLLF